MITQERLQELFTYNPETGFFRNRFSRGRAKETCRAGSPTGHGYRKLTVDYERIYEHQAAWLYVYGTWSDELDHKDRNRSNNAIDNLREATRTQNNFNAKRETGASGLKGAYLDKRTMNWYSHIQIGGVVKHLGSFGSAEEAHKAYMVAVDKYHGEFALHHSNP